MALRWLRLSLVFLVLVVSPEASADEADEQMQRALSAEQSLDFSVAAASYARVLELRPSASFAHRARIRLEDLLAHQEGDFEPLRRLETVRRSRQLASDPAALEVFWQEVQRFPPGRVQAESLLLLSEALVHRLNLPERAVAPASRPAQGAFDRPLRSRGLELWVDALIALGRRDQAMAALAALPGLSPALEQRFAAERRRHRMDRGAQGTLAALGGLLLAALWRLRGDGRGVLRALWAPTSLVLVAILVLVGSLLTLLFDVSLSVRPFLLLGPGVWVIDRSVALGRAALAGSTSRRILLASLGIASVFAWSYAVLRLSDPLYLESFGL